MPEEVNDNAITLDIHGYILKPFHESEFFETIGRVLGIQYIYEEEKPDASLTRYLNNSGAVEEDIAKLPDDLVLLMGNAVESANFHDFIDLINGIEIDNSELAKHLKALANDFNYDRLLQLLNKRN